MANNDFIQRLCSVLISMDVFNESEAKNLQDSFAASSKPNFDSFLLKEGLVSKYDLLRALAEVYQVPYLDVEGEFFDMAILHKFPKGMLLRLGVIPYQVDENMLILVASNPEKENLALCLGKYVSYDLRFMVGLRRNIEDAIKEFYDKSLTEVNEDEYMQETDIDDYGVYQEQELLQDEVDEPLLDDDDQSHTEC